MEELTRGRLLGHVKSHILRLPPGVREAAKEWFSVEIGKIDTGEGVGENGAAAETPVVQTTLPAVVDGVEEMFHGKEKIIPVGGYWGYEDDLSYQAGNCEPVLERPSEPNTTNAEKRHGRKPRRLRDMFDMMRKSNTPSNNNYSLFTPQRFNRRSGSSQTVGQESTDNNNVKLEDMPDEDPEPSERLENSLHEFIRGIDESREIKNSISRSNKSSIMQAQSVPSFHEQRNKADSREIGKNSEDINPVMFPNIIKARLCIRDIFIGAGVSSGANHFDIQNARKVDQDAHEKSLRAQNRARARLDSYRRERRVMEKLSKTEGPRFKNTRTVEDADREEQKGIGLEKYAQEGEIRTGRSTALQFSSAANAPTIPTGHDRNHPYAETWAQDEADDEADPKKETTKDFLNRICKEHGLDPRTLPLNTKKKKNFDVQADFDTAPPYDSSSTDAKRRRYKLFASIKEKEPEKEEREDNEEHEQREETEDETDEWEDLRQLEIPKQGLSFTEELEWEYMRGKRKHEGLEPWYT